MQIMHFQWAVRASGLALCAVLAGCSALPSAPPALMRYDLGAAPALQNPESAAAQMPIALADMQSPLQTDGSAAVHYRLAYADAQVLHAYTRARWSLPPSQLVQQRLREHLGQGNRPVLSAEAGVIAPSIQGRQVPVLRLALEEFSQVFSETERSVGWVRVRATLVDPAAQGDVLLGQRVFESRQPAQASNASAGVQALSRAVDDVGVQMNQWLDAVRRP